jgi:hypothetical protein
MWGKSGRVKLKSGSCGASSKCVPRGASGPDGKGRRLPSRNQRGFLRETNFRTLETAHRDSSTKESPSRRTVAPSRLRCRGPSPAIFAATGESRRSAPGPQSVSPPSRVRQSV